MAGTRTKHPFSTASNRFRRNELQLFSFAMRTRKICSSGPPAKAKRGCRSKRRRGYCWRSKVDRQHVIDSVAGQRGRVGDLNSGRTVTVRFCSIPTGFETCGLDKLVMVLAAHRPCMSEIAIDSFHNRFVFRASTSSDLRRELRRSNARK